MSERGVCMPAYLNRPHGPVVSAEGCSLLHCQAHTVVPLEWRWTRSLLVVRTTIAPDTAPRRMHVAPGLAKRMAKREGRGSSSCGPSNPCTARAITHAFRMQVARTPSERGLPRRFGWLPTQTLVLDRKDGRCWIAGVLGVGLCGWCWGGMNKSGSAGMRSGVGGLQPAVPVTFLEGLARGLHISPTLAR